MAFFTQEFLKNKLLKISGDDLASSTVPEFITSLRGVSFSNTTRAPVLLSLISLVDLQKSLIRFETSSLKALFALKPRNEKSVIERLPNFSSIFLSSGENKTTAIKSPF